MPMPELMVPLTEGEKILGFMLSSKGPIFQMVGLNPVGRKTLFPATSFELAKPLVS